MNRYLIYDNDNGVGAYLLNEGEDAEERAQKLLNLLGDNPDHINVYMLELNTYGDIEEMPNIVRVWKGE